MTKKVKRISGGTMTVAEQREKINLCATLYKDGKTINDIMVILKVSKPTVYKWLKLKGIGFSQRYRKYDAETIDRIAELYQTHTRGEVAEIMGMKYQDVMYIIDAYLIRKGEKD